MLRTVARVEERPWLLLGLVFLATCFFGFLVQAGGTVWLRLHADPIAKFRVRGLSATAATAPPHPGTSPAVPHFLGVEQSRR